MACVRLEEKADRVVVHLAGTLDIYAAKDACAALASALATTRPRLSLELSGLEELDLAGIQVLTWLRSSAQANGVAVELLATCPALQAAARSLNLTEWQERP